MDFTVDNIPALAGAAVLVFFAGYLVIRAGRRHKNAAAARAARAFRERVLAELEGLYPVPRSWSDDAYQKLKETIPGIESVAAEFRVFVPSEKRGSFDESLKNYCKHCGEITWQSCATFGAIPGKSRPDDVGPKEIFRQKVNTLLSFAKES
jgi:hypothetical protein